MEQRAILVVGSGHLAYRIRRLAESSGFTVLRPATDTGPAARSEGSTFEATTRALAGLDVASVRMAYLVDDRDERNLELLIALTALHKDVPVTATLFNESIAPHLQAANANIRILNPARIAAPAFVEALYAPVEHALRYAPVSPPEESSHPRADRLFVALTTAFIALLCLATAYFHFAEHLSWLNALYFVVVTMATVGYGDISLLNAPPASKLVGIGLILGSTFFIWLIFSLTVDRIIKKRVELSLGRRKYAYRDHVILCGLGRLGYFIGLDLLARGEKIVIVELNEHSPHIDDFRSRGAEVYIGDARLPRVLQDVGVGHAKAVFSVIDNDMANIEIGLNARSFVPQLRLILRIFDDAMSRQLKETLDIQLTYSMTAIADEKVLGGS